MRYQLPQHATMGDELMKREENILLHNVGMDYKSKDKRIEVPRIAGYVHTWITGEGRYRAPRHHDHSRMKSLLTIESTDVCAHIHSVLHLWTSM